MNNLPNGQVVTLLRQIAKGDDSAAMVLYGAYRTQLFQFVRSRVWNDDAAKDIVQETLIGAFMPKSRVYDGSVLFSTWLCAIANNKIIDWHRREQRHPSVDSAVSDDDPPLEVKGSASVLDLVSEREGFEAILICIEKLPLGQREAIRLTALEDLSVQEAGVVLQVPSGTVKSRCHHARLAIEDCLARAAAPYRKGAARV